MKVSKPGLEAFLHGPRTEGCLDYMAGALNSVSPEESMNDPIVSRRCFSLWSPFSSFTSSLVAVIILLLAIPVSLLRQLHHRPPGQFLLYSHYTGNRRAVEGMRACVRAGLHVSMSMYDCTRGCVSASACQLLTHICFSLSYCTDQNECKEFGNSVCGTWHCENTIGSYRCFMGCQPGLQGEDTTGCGEWSNRE